MGRGLEVWITWVGLLGALRWCMSHDLYNIVRDESGHVGN